MKLSLTKFCVFLVLVSLLSCRKDKFDAYTGTATALKNGESWAAVTKAYSNSPDRITVIIDQYQGERKMNSLRLENLPYSGKHRIFRTLAASNVNGLYLDHWDGHSICTYYEVIESDSVSNYIEITEYNSSKRRVRGKFEVKFFLDATCAPGYPDTLHVKDGVFEVIVDK